MCGCPRATTRAALMAVLTAMLLLALPSAALAGHIQDRFSCPGLPDPNPGWTTTVDPQVSGIKVAYKLADVNGERWAYLWTIGAPLAVEQPHWDTFRCFDFSGSLVAYQGSDRKIYVSDGVTQYLVGGSGQCDRPRIAGDTVVWQDKRNGTWDIYAARLDPVTHAVLAETRVCAARGSQTRPDVGGNWVVWQDNRNGQFDIYGRNLVTDHARAFCTNVRPQDSPRTDGTRVVWVDWRSRAYGADIYGVRISGGATRAVCHARKNQKEPDVGGGFVVWTDYRNSAAGVDEPPNTSLRGYDWAAHASFTLDGTAGMQCEADMDGHTVVYNSYPDTHMGTPWWASIRGAHLQH